MKKVRTKVKNPLFSEEAINSMFALVVGISSIVLVVLGYLDLEGASLTTTQYALIVIAAVSVIVSFVAFVTSLTPILRFRKYQKVLKKQKVKSLVDLAEKAKIDKSKLEFDIKNLGSTNQLIKESPVISNYVKNKSLSNSVHFKYPERKLAHIFIQPVMILNFVYIISKSYENAQVMAIMLAVLIIVSATYLVFLMYEVILHARYKKRLEKKRFVEVSKKDEVRLKKMVEKGHVIGLSINKYSGRLVFPSSSEK